MKPQKPMSVQGLRGTHPTVRRRLPCPHSSTACTIPDTPSCVKSWVEKLLPLVGNVFSIYDLSDDQFALSSDYDLLYTELTGAVVLYLREYGI